MGYGIRLVKIPKKLRDETTWKNPTSLIKKLRVVILKKKGSVLPTITLRKPHVWQNDLISVTRASAALSLARGPRKEPRPRPPTHQQPMPRLLALSTRVSDSQTITNGFQAFTVTNMRLQWHDLGHFQLKMRVNWPKSGTSTILPQIIFYTFIQGCESSFSKGTLGTAVQFKFL